MLADLHFAPTEQSRNNLLAEHVDPGRIWVTGNTVIDALQDVLRQGRACEHPVLRRVAAERRRMILVTSHRRENHGKPQEQICSALLQIVERFPDTLIVFPVHLSPAVRDTVLPRLSRQDNIVLLEPTDYFETVHFMKNSYLILTDSGGIQEEAPALGKPVLVLRNTTERPEGVAAGTVRLVGTETGADRRRRLRAAGGAGRIPAHVRGRQSLRGRAGVGAYRAGPRARGRSRAGPPPFIYTARGQKESLRE